MTNSTTGYLTVTYAIHDQRAFKDERDRVFELFKEQRDSPWTVTAVSVNHEVHRLELIEEAVNDLDVHTVVATIEEILSATNIGTYKSLEDFRNRQN